MQLWFFSARQLGRCLHWKSSKRTLNCDHCSRTSCNCFGLEQPRKGNFVCIAPQSSALPAFITNTSARHPRGHLPFNSLEALALSFLSQSAKSKQVSPFPVVPFSSRAGSPSTVLGAEELYEHHLSAFYIICWAFSAVLEARGISDKDVVMTVLCYLHCH